MDIWGPGQGRAKGGREKDPLYHWSTNTLVCVWYTPVWSALRRHICLTHGNIFCGSGINVPQYYPSQRIPTSIPIVDAFMGMHTFHMLNICVHFLRSVCVNGAFYARQVPQVGAFTHPGGFTLGRIHGVYGIERWEITWMKTWGKLVWDKGAWGGVGIVETRWENTRLEGYKRGADEGYCQAGLWRRSRCNKSTNSSSFSGWKTRNLLSVSKGFWQCSQASMSDIPCLPNPSDSIIPTPILLITYAIYHLRLHCRHHIGL